MYIMKDVIIKAMALSVPLVLVAITLGGCGNTVKGVGADIVEIGESMIGKPKNEK
jgi:predicted small secreted protein|tara:strand:- start:84 stop:248 length:165 start_codon:yes stop_codon:yes gene_type:complete